MMGFYSKTQVLKSFLLLNVILFFQDSFEEIQTATDFLRLCFISNKFKQFFFVLNVKMLDKHEEKKLFLMK